MVKNMGKIDIILRMLTAITVFGCIYFTGLAGTWAWVLGALSGVLLLTSLVSFCPTYRLFGITTCSTK